MTELEILIARYRQIPKDTKEGKHLRKRITELLMESDEEVTVETTYKKTFSVSEMAMSEWFVDAVIESKNSPLEVLIKDIESDINFYVPWEDTLITIKDKDGKIINSFT